jgi:hypothetical protein
MEQSNAARTQDLLPAGDCLFLRPHITANYIPQESAIDSIVNVFKREAHMHQAADDVSKRDGCVSNISIPCMIL